MNARDDEAQLILSASQGRVTRLIWDMTLLSRLTRFSGLSVHALGDDRAALPVLERAHSLNPAGAKLTAGLERMRAAQKQAQ